MCGICNVLQQKFVLIQPELGGKPDLRKLRASPFRIRMSLPVWQSSLSPIKSFTTRSDAQDRFSSRGSFFSFFGLPVVDFTLLLVVTFQLSLRQWASPESQVFP